MEKQLEIFDLIPGFYVHYKHDPAKGINDHVYEFLNIGHHTEIEGLDESAMVVYQPLYEQAGVYTIGKHWDLRPRTMFLSDKEIENGSSVKRFKIIEDKELVKKLVEIRNKMYGSELKYYTGDDL